MQPRWRSEPTKGILRGERYHRGGASAGAVAAAQTSGPVRHKAWMRNPTVLRRMASFSENRSHSLPLIEALDIRVVRSRVGPDILKHKMETVG